MKWLMYFEVSKQRIGAKAYAHVKPHTHSHQVLSPRAPAFDELELMNLLVQAVLTSHGTHSVNRLNPVSETRLWGGHALNNRAE